MTEYVLLTVEIDPRGVASVMLNRPEVHNAFNEALIAELTRVFHELDANAAVRLAVLSGNGKSFCTGGDINWMKAMKNFTEAENMTDSQHLARMFSTIHDFTKPLIGVVHGFAYGGGSGLAAVCDYVIATDTAMFGFTEMIGEFLKAAPIASRKAKALVREVVRLSKHESRQELTGYTVSSIAHIRTSPEAQEGMGALLEKRKPNWIDSK